MIDYNLDIKRCIYCIMYCIIKRNVDYYTERDSDCYMLMFDASKAFESVEYVRSLAY